jgi:hypothetical protein
MNDIKKEKSKVIGFRLPLELYKKTNEISKSYQYSFVDVVKKALNFFIDNPERVITFKKFIPNSFENGFYEDPVYSIKKIRDNGINTREELLWIAELLQSAWYHYENYKISSKKVEKIILIIKTLIYDYDLNKIERIDYIKSKFPEKESKDIKNNIDKALNYIKNKTRISAGYAESVSRCLMEIIKDESINIPIKKFIEINKLIDEEIIWVATKGIIINNGKDIDTTPLTKNRRLKDTNEFQSIYKTIKTNSISILYYLSEKNYINEEPFKKEFSYVIYILDKNKTENKEIASFTGNAQTLFNLKSAIDSLNDTDYFNHKNNNGAYEEWELYTDPESEFNYIQYKSTIRIYLNTEEMQEFIDQVNKFYNDKDVKNDVLSEYADRFGII